MDQRLHVVVDRVLLRKTGLEVVVLHRSLRQQRHRLADDLERLLDFFDALQVTGVAVAGFLHGHLEAVTVVAEV